MKQMTTAEFAKANLAALEEPVEIRRYTTVVGVYYPQGYQPPNAVINMSPEASPEQVEALRLQLDAISPTLMEAAIRDKDEEIARLKRELARRSQPALAPTPMTQDPFAGLAKQDRDFFERKLGKRK